MPQPRYREIADDLELRIANGEFRPGDTLPGIGILMAYYGVSGLNTIRSAQEVLRTKRLIDTVPGKGSFVRTKPVDNIGDSLGRIERALLDAQAALEHAKSLTAH